MWTKVLALQKCMVYIGLFHPCEHRANISDKDQGIELAFSIALADPNFPTTQRLSAFAQCPQLPEASRRSTGVKFGSRLSKFVLFLVDSDFLFVNNGEKFEESVMNLRICSMYA